MGMLSRPAMADRAVTGAVATGPDLAVVTSSVRRSGACQHGLTSVTQMERTSLEVATSTWERYSDEWECGQNSTETGQKDDSSQKLLILQNVSARRVLINWVNELAWEI